MIFVFSFQKIMLLQALEAKRVVESDYNTVLSLVTLLHQNEAANGNDTHALRLECLSEVRPCQS